MDVRTYFEQEAARKANEARAVTNEAELAGRPMTSEERAKVEGLIAEVTTLKGRVVEIDDNERLREAIEGANSIITSKPTSEASQPASTAGEAFIRSEAYRALKARGLKGRWSTGPVELGQKVADDAPLTTGNVVQSITDAGGTLPLTPQVLPIVGAVQQALVVADLFGQGVATQNSIVYLEETHNHAGAHNADPYGGVSNLSGTLVTLTNEANLKPAARVDFAKRTAAVDKIAAFLPISDEMLEDEPQIASYITGRLPMFIRQAEEQYLLDKLAVGSSANDGDIGGQGMLDAIAAGILKCSVAGGLDADAVLINPTDFWKMSVQKSGVGNTYFSGGPYAGPARTPWGIAAVVTTAVAPGAPIVGAFKAGATVFRKGGLSVEASNSHSDYFVRNLTALRAEERLALVTLRPTAFVAVTVTS